MSIVLLIIFVFTFTPLVLVEFARKNSSSSLEEFFLQGRAMPLLLVFFTVYATWVSSFAFLGSTESFFSKGPLYMTCFAWNVLFGLLFMIFGRRMWHFGKVYGYMTPTDFFNGIYHSIFLNITVTGILAVFTLPYLMIQLYGGAYIIETASNGMIPWRAAGLVFYLVIIIYLWAGGLRALAMTDVFYGMLTFATMLITGLIFIQKTGGVEKTYALIVEKDASDVVLSAGFSANSPWAWLCMFLIIPIGALMSPPMWIRAYAAKNERIFKIMPVLLSAVTIMYLGPLLIAAAAKVLYPDISANDSLIPYMLINHVPIVAATLLLCGIAAAALSTANSQIHALSALYTIDIHKRYLRPHTQERQLISISKWAILLLSAVAYVLLLKSPGMIIDMGILALGGTMQVIVPTLGALLWVRSNGVAATVGLLTSVTILCMLCFVLNISAVYAAVIALAANAVIFIGLSLALPMDKTAMEQIIKHQKSFAKRNRR